MNGWIDPTVSLGTLIHLIVLTVTLIGLYWKLRELVFRLHNENRQALSELRESTGKMESKVDSLWDWFTNRLERRTRPQDYGG